MLVKRRSLEIKVSTFPAEISEIGVKRMGKLQAGRQRGPLKLHAEYRKRVARQVSGCSHIIGLKISAHRSIRSISNDGGTADDVGWPKMHEQIRKASLVRQPRNKSKALKALIFLLRRLADSKLSRNVNSLECSTDRQPQAIPLLYFFLSATSTLYLKGA